MEQKAVILFCQAGCPPCEWAKIYLEGRGISFQERDVRSDPEAVRELVEIYQSHSTPTIIVGGKVMIGFDPERLEELLSE
ncbi:MAG TPA: glutaredoxin domain-containing protein [Terriglobales bacterium]|jgi:glutaredoxin|nr:glutaredoxin domain-containing protein [Terriglobales bacterium]